MEQIVFFDSEIEPKRGSVLDIGGISEGGGRFHSDSVSAFVEFLRGAKYVCGHNIINHDLLYLGGAVDTAGITEIIDTLPLSPLMFPARPYHRLLKDDKLQSDDINNPFNDSMKARDLFYDEVAAFRRIDEELKLIYYMLLYDKKEFCSFFHFVGYNCQSELTANRPVGADEGGFGGGGPDDALLGESLSELEKLIRRRFLNKICEQADLARIIREHPTELAYCLALINTDDRYSITPPWVLKNYSSVDGIMHKLRDKPCLTGCAYCSEALDIYGGLKKFFGYDSFRTYAGAPLQEKAVGAAIAQKSFLAVFPTGGGKSITFQLPALMNGVNTRGLTVVISPLQSLMKDQVDNLEKLGITDAVTINGLLNPVERAKSIERVENGSASILYISPELLRSRTIESLLLGRKIVRFVVDEAHCFSAWGQDFRVDYLYIGDFIRKLREKKNLDEGIPVSCFTATAKRRVIDDIKEYFKSKLSLEMEVFSSDAARTNLNYMVFARESEEEKYNTVRDLLGEKDCPTIIYVSRTRKAYNLAKRLTEDGFDARPYHGRMDGKEKKENQNAFINGEVQVMVATSAFGMGVDKKDVGMVIHYEISDSLENYIQEAGRAGRDESVTADCYVLFNDEDLNKHFILLNQTKLSIREIQQVWKAVKDVTKKRMSVSKSALEIARQAGWDDTVADIETKVRTAISALEETGYLKRGQNMPRIYATGILAENAQQAIDKINASSRFDDKQKEHAVRIIKKLISSRSRKKASGEEAESRVDYISDHLGIPKQRVIEIVNLLRDEKILADSIDMTAFIRRRKNGNNSLDVLKVFVRLENFLISIYKEGTVTYNLKKLNEQAWQFGCNDVTLSRLRTIFNLWAIAKWIKRHYDARSNNHVKIRGMQIRYALEEKLAKRHELAQFIIEYLFDKSKECKEKENDEEVRVDFSVVELKEEYKKVLKLFSTKVTFDEVEDALFYLSKIGAIELEGGFLVSYNALSLERTEKDGRKRYTANDYKKLERFYESKIQQIHIVGEYARKMMEDYNAALQFVDDYFRLNYSSFLNKYFPGSRQNDIKKSITPEKFKRLFGGLSATQLKVINDSDSKYIVVAAGPGSGKTKILAHKLASLLLIEDVKHEQLLMLTFSRSAATEFKKRLLDLYGNAAIYVEIKTFHSYCFDLLGKVGTLDDSDRIIKEAAEKIRSGDIETSRITKAVLVIDEAQDMNDKEFELISALMEQNEEMRVIAVGDDDQNIYGFRGSSPKHMERLILEKKAVMYELAENYRSKANLVGFTNQLASRISHRLKRTPIIPVQQDNGRLRIFRYRSNGLITPVAGSVISSELSGTTCVMTRTNDEALRLAGLLVESGLPAKLIQSNEGFSLYNLREVRYFLDILDRPRTHGRAASNACDQPGTHGRAASNACDQPGMHGRAASNACDQPRQEYKPATAADTGRREVNGHTSGADAGLSAATCVISGDVWDEAKRKLAAEFYYSPGRMGEQQAALATSPGRMGEQQAALATSPNFELCMNMIMSFEATNPKQKYRSDLDIFIRESKMEDFCSTGGETIYVSTMHKAKGREFDNVFIMLDGYGLNSDEAIRLLYVAMTRAKRELIIHYNGNYLNHIKADGIERIEDSKTYKPLSRLVIQLSHKDVWLDYFLNVQRQVSQLKCGDILIIDESCCKNINGNVVLKFSKKFSEQIALMEQKNYIPIKAAAKFIVYWRKEDTDNEALIILPEIIFALFSESGGE